MDNLLEQIKHFINNPQEPISYEWCSDALSQYPFFILPAVLYLQRSKNNSELTAEERKKLLARIAIATPDRAALKNIIEEGDFDFSSFYPTEPIIETPTTNNAIDTFLNTFGSSNEKEIEILDRMIFNPTPDYADILAAQEKKETTPNDDLTSKNDKLISDFIEKSRKEDEKIPHVVTENQPVSEDEKNQLANQPITKPQASNDSMLSESLAKIYIKQHKYSKALEIIMNLSLNFPEKSVYFADQMRFLKKLIVIEQIKNKN